MHDNQHHVIITSVKKYVMIFYHYFDRVLYLIINYSWKYQTMIRVIMKISLYTFTYIMRPINLMQNLKLKFHLCMDYGGKRETVLGVIE